MEFISWTHSLALQAFGPEIGETLWTYGTCGSLTVVGTVTVLWLLSDMIRPQPN
jgi:hypothetical protein